MERKKCIICEKEDFRLIHTIKKFPIQMWNTTQEPEKDVLLDFTIIGCTYCGCVQLRYIVEPSILYTQSYSTPLFSPIWIEHHRQFSEFILNTTSAKNFLEIGANAGQLYSLLSKDRDIEYSSLDITRHRDLPAEVACVEGNCEEFDYTGHSTIILSHVFGHLLDPRKFLESIRDAHVDEVYISIPDFNHLEAEEYTTLLTTQHTFSCGESYIRYLFSLYGYYKEIGISFQKHSIILKFKAGSYYSLMVPRELYHIDNVQKTFDKYYTKINATEISSACYICPAGMYGQMLYLSLEDKQKYILGFIDGDKRKNNTRLYGTDKLTYLPSKLLEYSESPITVILCRSPYENELRKYLEEYADNIRIIRV